MTLVYSISAYKSVLFQEWYEPEKMCGISHTIGIEFALSRYLILNTFTKSIFQSLALSIFWFSMFHVFLSDGGFTLHPMIKKTKKLCINIIRTQNLYKRCCKCCSHFRIHKRAFCTIFWKIYHSVSLEIAKISSVIVCRSSSIGRLFLKTCFFFFDNHKNQEVSSWVTVAVTMVL